MPSHSIFNEWYAAQISKKNSAEWAMKAANGKCISSTVHYDYKKDPNGHEKWLIDEPASEVVRKIYALCIAGIGPFRIAEQLEAEKILVPSAYQASQGRKQVRKMQQ